MINDILLAIPLGVILAFTIGPVFFVLLETSVTKGFRAALVFDLGVVFGDFVFILIAYFSTNQILEQFKDNPVLFVFGGLIMFSFGLISYIKQRKDFLKQQNEEIETLEITKKNYLGLFFKGFLLNFINIGILGFWMGIIIVFGPQLEMNPNRIFVFFLGVMMTYLVTDISKILLAKQLRKKLTPTVIYKIKRVISFILMIFGFFFILQGFFPEGKQKIEEKIEEIKAKP